MMVSSLVAKVMTGATIQKDMPIPARPRAHTPLGEAVSPRSPRDRICFSRVGTRCRGRRDNIQRLSTMP
jgi:hypothetical protein